MLQLGFVQLNNAVRILVRVIPNAKHSRIMLKQGDQLVNVRLAARPVEGCANKELVKVFADAFKIKPSQVNIAKGEKSRIKCVDIQGGFTIQNALKIISEISSGN